MNPIVGWALAAAALVAGWLIEGPRGLALGFTLVVFWLVLQFNRSVRVMRRAGESPVGHVESAVMLQAKLREGQQMLDVLALTKSLGRRGGEGDDVWVWTDPGGAEVVVTFRGGRCAHWRLQRPSTPE